MCLRSLRLEAAKRLATVQSLHPRIPATALGWFSYRLLTARFGGRR